jgi:hypothetical protein
MQGIIDGKWIITMNWILDSAKHKKWQEGSPTGVTTIYNFVESSYEEEKRFPGSKKSREIHSKDSSHKLFEGKKFYLYGETEPPRADLEKLLGAMGGKITTASKADVILKGNVEPEEEEDFSASKIPIVKLDFIFESVAMYEPQKEKKFKAD